MILSPMRFKNFVWPHNPRVYSIAFERKLAVHKIPFGRYRVQSLGQTRRVLRGQGEFAGERAYETFKALASIFYEETPGVLVHPVWMTTTAWFAGLELRQEPRRDYVAYSFEFREVVDGDGEGTLSARPGTSPPLASSRVLPKISTSCGWMPQPKRAQKHERQKASWHYQAHCGLAGKLTASWSLWNPRGLGSG